MSSSKKLIQASAGNVAGGSFYDYEIENSLRFNTGNTDYLTFTPSTNGNNTTFTLRFMVKLGNLDKQRWLFLTNTSVANAYTGVRINANNTLEYFNASPGVDAQMITSSVFRDVSSWYDIVISVSSTNVDIYVNGVEQPYGTVNQPSGADTGVNLAGTLMSTSTATPSAGTLDGYLAEMVLIDGQALTPTSFGEFKNGIWVPKDCSGLSFGTNGAYLKFGNSGALGTDSSGNSNNWTVNGLTSSDQMPDTPTNNFATLNPLLQFPYPAGYYGAMYNGNLEKEGAASNAYTGAYSTIAMSPNTGKWYSEHYVQVLNRNAFGISYSPTDAGSMNPNDSATYGYYLFCYYGWGYSNLYATASTIAQQVTNLSAGGIVGILYDSDNSEVTFFVNGTQAGSTMSVPSATYLFFADGYGVSPKAYNVSNFGQDSTFGGRITAGGNTDANDLGDFKYTVPTGALALCTANLPEPTIGPNSDIKPSDVFGVEIYTGNGTAIGSGGNAVDCGVDMTDGDYMVAIKDRDSAVNWMVFDTVRGDGKFIEFNTTNPEYTNSETLTFTSTGVTLGSNGNVNSSGNDYVLYWFKATAGFFDIVSFDLEATGNINIPHNLGVSPQFLTMKALSNGAQLESWFTYCESLPVSDPETDFIYLDKTNVVADNNTVWNDTAPTSSVFTVGSGFTIANYGTPQIAYLFADVEGFCKIGYYKGNGSTDGPFHYLGFSPEMSISRSSSTTSNWIIQDTERNTYNPADTPSILDGADAEYTANSQRDFVSNGLKMRATGTPINLSGEDYITLSIGTSSKYSNAR